MSYWFVFYLNLIFKPFILRFLGTIFDLFKHLVCCCCIILIEFFMLYKRVCVCVCVCYWIYVHVVFPNYEVVEFQPGIVTLLESCLRWLLLYIDYWPTPTSTTAVWCPSEVGTPLLPWHLLHRHLSCLRTGSSSQPGVICLCFNVPILTFLP